MMMQTRGVHVCKRWFDFREFLLDMVTRPVGRTLDRRNPNGKLYSKARCRWATRMEQRHNRRKP